MYRRNFKGSSQIELELGAFHTPFTTRLNPQNRWVKLAGIIPWAQFEEQYSSAFGAQGRPAYPFRLAIGALILQAKQKLTDRELVEQIAENPYYQFFLGLPKFQDQCPFDNSTLVYFRKRITSEMLQEMNDVIVASAILEKKMETNEKKDDDRPGDSNDSPGQTHQGKLILDATCVPEDIRFPTDISLLNDAREATQRIIDQMWKLHPNSKGKRKPRTHRERLNKAAYSILRMKKPRQNPIRKVTRLLILGLKRNLAHIGNLNDSVPLTILGKRAYRQLLISAQIASQQAELYRLRKNEESASIPDRIVSLFKPHVRPIVRGKASAPVEFGAKVSIGVCKGFIHVDHISFDPYHEGKLLKAHVDAYHERTGFYPKVILVDRAYQTRENRDICKSLGIRLSGKPLGRPSIFDFIEKAEKEIQRKDSAERNEVESKFGIGKRAKQLARIFTRLPETSKTVTCLIMMVLNLEKILRGLFLSIYYFWSIRIFNLFSFADETFGGLDFRWKMAA